MIQVMARYLNDAAEFIHRIVMVHLFRNWKISGHNVISYVRSILSQRWVGGPLCISTLQSE